MADTNVKTGKARFSYVHVFEPREGKDGGAAKYGVCLLIPKSDKKTIKKIEKAIELAYNEGKAKFGGKLPKKWHNPLRDGDEEREDSPEFEDMMFLNAKSNRRPGVVEIIDGVVEAIEVYDDFYSGCWGKATINFYAYNTEGSKGVACGLNNLLKTEDDERLGGGGATAEDDFADETDADDLMA